MATPNPTAPYLADSNLDDLGRMLMALLSETWVMRDRMHALEDLVCDRTGLSPQEIDDYCPAGPSLARLEAVRERLVANVVGAPLLAQRREVDDILRHSRMPRGDVPSR